MKLDLSPAFTCLTIKKEKSLFYLLFNIQKSYFRQIYVITSAAFTATEKLKWVHSNFSTILVSETDEQFFFNIISLLGRMKNSKCHISTPTRPATSKVGRVVT